MREEIKELFHIFFLSTGSTWQLDAEMMHSSFQICLLLLRRQLQLVPRRETDMHEALTTFSNSSSSSAFVLFSCKVHFQGMLGPLFPMKCLNGVQQSHLSSSATEPSISDAVHQATAAPVVFGHLKTKTSFRRTVGLLASNSLPPQHLQQVLE